MTSDKYIVVVFRSKTEVLDYIERLLILGVKATPTGTPKEAKIGCGIAAKLNARHLGVAQKVLAEGGYQGFFAIYSVVTDGLRTSRMRIK